MVDKKVVEYVQACIENKVPLPDIRRNLIYKGWPAYEVNRVINFAVNSMKNPPKDLPKISVKESYETSKKILIYACLIVGAVVVIFLIFLIFSLSKSDVISDNRLAEGTLIDLVLGKSVVFNLNGNNHKIVVDSMDIDFVK